MANKQVQEKLCTEPKETPAEALQFAIAFEDGLKRQRTYGYIGNETKIKEEPVCTISGNRQNTKDRHFLKKQLVKKLFQNEKLIII